ncbi:MAG TPA: ATP-binding protein [Conexibacter sp.]|jgi:anti-sigma regulatory factor (Ser/Thr protein kinase)
MQADAPTSQPGSDLPVAGNGGAPAQTTRTGISLTLAASADAPTLARRAAADALGHWGQDRRDIALLVISELVTNAVRYGARGHGDRVSLSVRHRDGTTRIEVTDRRARGGAVAESWPRGSGGQRSGWGLPIVAELTDRWGVEHGPGRTCVWCEIDCA